jgi:hypothetical protein
MAKCCRCDEETSLNPIHSGEIVCEDCETMDDFDEEE